MRWISCHTGAFPKRLYFENLSELDRECERLLADVYYRKFGKEFTPPLDDDSLQVLVEEYADVDLYATLPRSVEGETEFRPGQRPLVKISESLSSNEQRRNRMRTTIAHEWFHAVYHRYAWELRWARARVRTGQEESGGSCHEDTIIGAPEDNWTEFQAGYASCSILMPRSYVLIEAQRASGDNVPEISSVIAHVAQFFNVSTEAARWRLSHLGILGDLKAKRQLTLW
ncbi:ImmA/IrrE family metallo-endopeptidase [Polyangium mundeleinium]|uniref:ImmA/IrrE family metallo-endopeptidase n=1 Tax=Polyangium mundeleinium TaxID=2995306 RepID=A0ABT5F926_9BACT|nr:ImmA/IrrE family metallo-endopeptidase [Polyangium mundeleinium]MDC0750007.1 ImmA/IrrE family metallo-endopeptidase [Polyangium mundeleinium]